MLIQALLIAICAWIACANIEFLCWSVGLCAPFIWGPIVGLILGDVGAGLAIGTTTMLVYLGNIVIGGVTAVDFTYASVIATALTILTKQPPEMGCTIAVTMGMIGMLATESRWTLNCIWVHNADKCAAKGDTRGIFINNVIMPQVVRFFLYVIPAFLAVYYGAEYFQKFMDLLPKFIVDGMLAVGMLLPSLGLALLIKAIFKVKFVPFLILGYVFVAYFKLTIIPVTLIGIACALLYWNFGPKEENQNVN
ncbi:MAG: PTS sugar transporter subunit IIC [Bacilli bacterium]